VEAGGAAAAGEEGLAGAEPAVGVGGVALHLGRLRARPAAAAWCAGARRGVKAEAKGVVDEDDGVGVVRLLDLEGERGPAREHEEHALGAAVAGLDDERLARVVGDSHSGHDVEGGCQRLVTVRRLLKKHCSAGEKHIMFTNEVRHDRK
jgi:hypothetical protein